MWSTAFENTPRFLALAFSRVANFNVLSNSQFRLRMCGGSNEHARPPLLDSTLGFKSPDTLEVGSGI